MRLHLPGVFKGQRVPRGKIKKFTDGSRRRLLRVVNSIDRSKFDPKRVIMVTLTYPKSYPSARASKKHLDTFLKRLERAYGRMAIIWKLEPQKRGAPHYHLLLFLTMPYCEESLIPWVSNSWYEVVDSGDEKHLRAGTRVEQIRDWGGVASYAAKYLGKSCTSEGWDFPGRFWGKRYDDMLPIQIEKREVSGKVAAVLRRACLRWFKRQPSGWYYVPGRPLGAGQHQPGLKLHGTQPFSLNGGTPLSQCWEILGRITGQAVRPLRRRWRRSSGGCSMFMPAELVERLLPWALTTAGG